MVRAELQQNITNTSNQLSGLLQNGVSADDPRVRGLQEQLSNQMAQLNQEVGRTRAGSSSGSENNTNANGSTNNNTNSGSSVLDGLKSRLLSIISILGMGGSSPEQMIGKYASGFEGAGQVASDAIGTAADNPSIATQALSLADNAFQISGELKSQVGITIAALKDNQKKSKENIKQSDAA